jgi:malate dehydrogenase (quinone)
MIDNDKSCNTEPDVVLIGAGIMSATLGVLLKELQPDITIEIFERLDVAAAESSDAWNNAGTGHSAFCELNYTPEQADGTIETKKAVQIAESFELSRQFWAYLVQQNRIKSPESFIQSIPHMSFVWGKNNVEFLRKRYEAMRKCPLFQDMEYTEDPVQLQKWMPLVMEGRSKSEKLAATRMAIGTDVNFGALTRDSFDFLHTLPGVNLHFNQEVKKLRQEDDGRWYVKIKDLETGEKRKLRARFVFIGAGGGSLPLLMKSGIPEGKGFGGFPVSGQWLVCNNPDIIERHQAKVYGKAAVGSPPMSVPHLDTRVINGKKALLFGPYAGFSTKFLKSGSFLDLPLSHVGGRVQEYSPYPLPHQPGAAVSRRPAGGAEGLPAHGTAGRLAAGTGRSAGAGDQERPDKGGRAGIRHRNGKCRRWHHRSLAGRLPGCLYRCGHHAAALGALL